MRDAPGFGAIAESMGGLRYVSGHPDRPPVRVGISVGDSIAALHAVIGAMMALRHRDARGGRWNGKAGDDRVDGEGPEDERGGEENGIHMTEKSVAAKERGRGERGVEGER